MGMKFTFAGNLFYCYSNRLRRLWIVDMVASRGESTTVPGGEVSCGGASASTTFHQVLLG